MRAHFLWMSVAVGAIAACNSEPAAPRGVAGAGVTTRITGITHDSTGYTVNYQIANRDTAMIEYGACAGVVQELGASGWTTVTEHGQCILIGLGLPGGYSGTAAISRQTLTPGSQVRVVFGYDLASSRGSSFASTTDPVLVGDPLTTTAAH